MARVYLHNISLDNFMKYYLNGDTNIGSNARYQPAPIEYKVQNYYQYVYVINNKEYSFNTVEIPKLNYEDETFKALFNIDFFSNGFSYTSTDVKYKIPEINETLFNAIIGLRNDDDICDFIKNHYDIEQHAFEIDETVITRIYKTTSSPTGYITGTEQKNVYYIPINDPVSRVLKNLSMYKYYIKLKNRTIPAVELIGNTFYYVYNQHAEDDGDNSTVGRISINELYSNELLVDMSKQILDTVTNCKYYSIKELNHPEIECGRVYELPKYKYLEYNNNGEAKYIDTYTGQYKYFSEDTMPISPIMKYHNYMRKYKESYYGSDQDTNDATKYPETNKAYYVSYANCDEIGYGLKYTKRTNYPAANAYETKTSALSDFVSTVITKTNTSRGNMSSKTDLTSLNTVISWLSANYNFKLSESIIGDSTAVTNLSQQNPGKYDDTETSKLTNSEIRIYNKYLNSLGYNLTDSENSRLKTFFSTNNLIYIKKFTNMNGKHDTATQPYLSYGITVNTWMIPQCINDTTTRYELHILNKVLFEKFQHYKNISDYIVLDTVSTTEKQFDENYLLQNCPIYYYEVAESGEIQPDSTVGNEVLYKVYLTPLAQHIERTIRSLNVNSANDGLLTKESIRKNTSYKYYIDTSIEKTANKVVYYLTSLRQNLKSSTLHYVKAAFNAAGAYKNSSSIIATPVSYGSTTLDVKKTNAFDTIYPAIVNSQNSNTLLTTESMDKFNVNQYVDSLFKNLLYLNSNNTYYNENEGGHCVDKNTHNAYFGFIDYDSTQVDFSYTKHDNYIENATESDIINLTEIEQDSIVEEIETKNPLSRLFNYKQYTINAEEIEANVNNFLYKKINENIASTERITFNDLSSTNTRTYDENYFDVTDIVEKSFNILTDYLYCDNRINYTAGYYTIDKYESSTDKSKQSFYRRDIQNYIYKLINNNNKYLYTNNNNYNIKYIFNNTNNDKTVFIDLLKLLSKKEETKLYE